MTATRPNVLLIMTDQQRADFTAGAGFELDTMPFVDTLAARGTGFRNALHAGARLRARADQPAHRPLSRRRTGSGRTAPPTPSTRGRDLLDLLARRGLPADLRRQAAHVPRQAEDFDSSPAPTCTRTGPDGDAGATTAFADWLRSIDHGPATGADAVPAGVGSSRTGSCRTRSRRSTQRDPDRPFFRWALVPRAAQPVPGARAVLLDVPAGLVPDRAHGPEAALAKGGTVPLAAPAAGVEAPRVRRPVAALSRDVLRHAAADRRPDAAAGRAPGRATGSPRTPFSCSSPTTATTSATTALQRKGAGMPEILMRIPFFVAGPGRRGAATRPSSSRWWTCCPTLCEALGRADPVRRPGPEPLAGADRRGVSGRGVRQHLRGARLRRAAVRARTSVRRCTSRTRARRTTS